MQRKELVPPKMDIVFESLFKTGNEEITKALISNIIEQKIQKIDLEKNKRLLREYTKNKLGILDLIATLDDGVICHIEVQLSNNKDIEERLLFYNSKIYSQQMLIGEKYKDLKKTISIAILDYSLEKLRDLEKAHTKWYIIEDEEMMRIIDLRKKAIWDHNQAMFVAREEGREQGEKREKLKIAKKMLEEKIAIEIIEKVTGISKEKLKELYKKL